jgi:hypothetical protein
MTDTRLAGIALIAGSAAMIITMASHPQSIPANPDVAEAVAHMLIAVHSLALASVPVLFLGAWGLSRRLDAPGRMAMVGLVLYGFALVAVTSSAVFDGLVAPSLIRRIVAATPANHDLWQLAMLYNFELNQAFARLFAVASSIAILLWSVAIVRRGVLSRAVGIYGCVIAPLIIVAVASGLLTPNVHSFGALIFAQASWFVAVGAQLYSGRRA